LNHPIDLPLAFFPSALPCSLIIFWHVWFVFVWADYTKDFEAARRVGMHAVLLNRYGEEELAQEWKRRGAIVFDDLMDVVWWLGQSDCQLG
jgi:hypothetical protein